MGQMWYTAALGGMQMRAAARAIIFDKLTRLRCVYDASVVCFTISVMFTLSFSDTDVGAVVTMGLNDAQRLQECGQFLTFLYQGPVTAIVVMIVLLFVIGPAVFAGFVVLFLLIPLQRAIAKKVGKVSRVSAVKCVEVVS